MQPSVRLARPTLCSWLTGVRRDVEQAKVHFAIASSRAGMGIEFVARAVRLSAMPVWASRFRGSIREVPISVKERRPR